MKFKLGPYSIDVVKRAQSDMGEFAPDTLTIYINENLADQMLDETLLHENLHGIFDITGLAYELTKQYPGDVELEERIVRRVAPMLLLWLRDNKVWVKTVLDRSR